MSRLFKLTLVILLVTWAPIALMGEITNVIMEIDLPHQTLQQFEEVLTTTSNNLLANGIQLVIREGHREATNIKLSKDNLESVFVDIEVFTPKELAVSPILYSLHDLRTQIIFRQMNRPLAHEEVQDMAAILTGLSLYSVERCDLAELYFNEVESWVIEWSLPVNLYRGNCAVIDNELENAANYYNDAMYFANDVSTSVAANTNFAWTLMQLPNESRIGFQVNNLDAAIWIAVCVRGFCDPVKEVESFKRRAKLYVLNNEYDKAIQSIDSALARIDRNTTDFDPLTKSATYLLRGEIYRNIYEWDRSLEDFNTAIDLAPDYAEAYFQRGLLYYSVLQTGQELRDEALGDFQRYLDLWPEGPDANQAREYIAVLEAEIEALNAP